MIEFLVTFAGVLAAAITVDTQLQPKIPILDRRKLSLIRGSLTSSIRLFDSGSLKYTTRILIILAFLILANLLLLIIADPITSEVVFSLFAINPIASLGLLATTYLICLWSFSQSLFFIKLANRLTSLVGMLYLFVSDMVLSTIIFIFGLSAYFTIVNLVLEDTTKYSTSIAVAEYCDPTCQNLGVRFLVGSKFEGLLWTIPVPKEAEEARELYMLDDDIENAELVSINDTTLSKEELGFIQTWEDEKKFGYGRLMGFLRIDFDVSKQKPGTWEIFTFFLKRQIDEIWRHFRFSFQYYSFQQYAFGVREMRESSIFDELDLFTDGEAFRRLIPDPEERTRMANLLLSGKLPEEDSARKLGFDAATLLDLARFQWSKWIILGDLGDQDVFKNYGDPDFRKILQNKGLNPIYGNTATRSYFIPVTTFWVASISLSSIFLFFIALKGVSFAALTYHAALGARVADFPFTFLVAIFFPIFYSVVAIFR